MNLNNVKNSFETLLQVGITPLMVGHRGVGKTEIVRQFCKENEYELIEVRLGQLSDASDILGLCDFKTDENGNKVATKFLPPDYLMQYIKSGKKFIIFLDEINRCHKDLLQSIFELVYDKKISCNGFYIPEGSGIISAMNPATEEYDVLDFTDEAFNDRFCHIKVEASVNEWINYARKQKISPSIIDFISEQNSMLEPKLSEFSLGVSPSRRSWMIAHRLEKICKDKNIFSELLMGLVGIESGTSYISFLNNYDKLVSAVDILKDYSKVKEKILKFASVEDNRNDILSVITDGLFIYFEEKSEKSKVMTKKETNNLIDFIIDLPIGSGYGFLKQLMNEKLSYIFEDKKGEMSDFVKDEKLINYFKPHMEELNKKETEGK